MFTVTIPSTVMALTIMAVPCSYAGRRKGINSNRHQESQSGMEYFIRSAGDWHPKPPPRGCLLGQRSDGQRLFGRVRRCSRGYLRQWQGRARGMPGSLQCSLPTNELQPKWYTLKSKRKGEKKKKGTAISGEVQMQFEMADPSNPSATPREILRKFMAMASVSPGLEGDETDEFARTDSNDPNIDDDDDDDDDEDGEEKSPETSDETEESGKLDVGEKKRRKLRLKKLRRKTKARAYEFTGGTDVVGIVFVEICKITDLPPERNSRHLSVQIGSPMLMCLQ